MNRRSGGRRTGAEGSRANGGQEEATATATASSESHASMGGDEKHWVSTERGWCLRARRRLFQAHKKAVSALSSTRFIASTS